MSIKFILNGSETLFSLDKLPESLSLLKSAIINLFDFPEEVIEKDVKLFFKDEDGDKVNLESQNDFESLKNEPIKAILIEIEPKKLDQKPGPDVFPLIFDDGPAMEGLEPVVRSILEKRLKEIVPEIVKKLDAYYKAKYMNLQQKTISESHTQTHSPENFSVESQTNSPEKKCNAAASQTKHLDMAAAGVQTFIEKKEAEVQKSLAKQMEAQIQTEALMGFAEEFKAKEDLNKGKELEYFKPLSPKQNAPKIDSKKPSPVKNPEQMKVELVLLEVIQKNITIRDNIIKVKVVVQNIGEVTLPKKSLGLKIPEKFFLAGEEKLLDELKPNEIIELVYQIKNPGADGKYGGLLDLYHRENMKVLHSLPFEFEVKEDRFHGFSEEVIKKAEQMLEMLGQMDDVIVKKILEFFRDNKQANVDAAVDRYFNGGFSH